MNTWSMFAQTAPEMGGGELLAGGACMLVFVVIGVIAIALWVWALIDAIRNPALNSNDRLIWVLVIIFLQWIGAIVYVLFGRKKRS